MSEAIHEAEPRCEKHPDSELVKVFCGDCGGEGEVDRYEEDPLWYDEGDMYPCHMCEGRGWMRECLRCCPGAVNDLW